MDILLSQAKQYYKQGYLGGFTLKQVENGWIVLLHFNDCGLSSVSVSDARTRQRRVFNTLDAAFNLVISIGFEVSSLTVPTVCNVTK